MFGLAPLPRTLEAAVRDAGSERREVRRSAVRDLARHARASVEAERTLRRALLEDADADVRADAALALADAEARAAASDLCRAATEDLSARVRQLALLALGEIGEVGPPVLAVLESAGRSELPEERFQALLALHQLGASSAKSALVEGMADADPEVRRLAFRISRAEWSEAAELPPEVREKARAALTDEDPGVRVAAALALADFGDASGRSLLLEIVQRRSRSASSEDEHAAIEFVAELGLSEAVPVLRRRAFSRWFRDPFSYDARIALARLGDAEAKSAILRGLGAWSFDARTLAVAAVGRARLREARDVLVAWMESPERADPTAVREALARLDAEPGS